MDAAVKVYTECLFEKTRTAALPVWHPQPQRNSYRRGEVQLADVGYMSESGFFVKLFNCCEPLDPHGISTPSTHIPFEMPDEIFSWFEHQTEYRSSSVRIVDVSADVRSVQGGLGIGLKCTSKRGAALVISEGGLERKRIESTLIQNYVNKHYASWQSFADHKNLPSEKLFFVGGFAKAQKWLVVSFTDKYVNGGILLHPPSTPTSGVLGLWGSWLQSRSPRWNYGPGEPEYPPAINASLSVQGENDAQRGNGIAPGNMIQAVPSASSLGPSTLGFEQCAFIERYTCKGRWSTTPHRRREEHVRNNNDPRTTAQPHQPPQSDCAGNSDDQTLPHNAGRDNGPGLLESLEDSGSDKSEDLESPRDSGSDKSEDLESPGDSGSDKSEDLESSGDSGSDKSEDLQSLSSSGSAEDEPCDPLDELLEYMLETCPESTFATAGDRDIIKLMPEGIHNVYRFREELVKLKPRLKINQDRVVTLDSGDDCNMPALDTLPSPDSAPSSSIEIELVPEAKESVVGPNPPLGDGHTAKTPDQSSSKGKAHAQEGQDTGNAESHAYDPLASVYLYNHLHSAPPLPQLPTVLKDDKNSHETANPTLMKPLPSPLNVSPLGLIGAPTVSPDFGTLDLPNDYRYQSRSDYAVRSFTPNSSPTPHSASGSDVSSDDTASGTRYCSSSPPPLGVPYDPASVFYSQGFNLVAPPTVRSSATVTPMSRNWISDGDRADFMNMTDPRRATRIEVEQRRKDEIREGFCMLADSLPVSNQKSSKISLLDQAAAHIKHLEATTQKLQTRLQQVEAEASRLRNVTEALILGTAEQHQIAAATPAAFNSHSTFSVNASKPIPIEKSSSGSGTEKKEGGMHASND